MYTISAPTDTTVFYTGRSPLSWGYPGISYSRANRHADSSLAVDQVCLDGGATCTVEGVDGAKVTIVGAHCVTVAPPQAIVWGSCLAL